MRRLLFIIVLIGSLSACKDSVKEDPTPAPKQIPETKPTTQLTFESVSVILDKSVVINGKVSNAESGVKEYGFVYSKTSEFDLSSGTKISFGSKPDSHFTTQIQGLETKTNYNGKLYLIKENNEVIYSSAKQFSTIASNTWKTVANPPVVAYDGSGFVIGDTVYYIPGTVYPNSDVSHLYAFDLIENKWVSKGQLPFSSRVLTTTFSLNNKGYVMLGKLGERNSKAKSTDEVWEYDAATNKWTQKASCPSKMNAAVGFLLHDKFYVTMGVLSESSELDGKMYEYDPLTDTWTTKVAVHPSPHFARSFGNGFVHDGKGYIYAGAYQFVPFSEYNPDTDTWALYDSPVPGIERPVGVVYGRNNTQSVIIKNRLFTALGDSRNGRDMYQYDMVDKSWLKKGTYPDDTHSGFLTNFKDMIIFVSSYQTFIYLPESD